MISYAPSLPSALSPLRRIRLAQEEAWSFLVLAIGCRLRGFPKRGEAERHMLTASVVIVQSFRVFSTTCRVFLDFSDTSEERRLGGGPEDTGRRRLRFCFLAATQSAQSAKVCEFLYFSVMHGGRLSAFSPWAVN